MSSFVRSSWRTCLKGELSEFAPTIQAYLFHWNYNISFNVLCYLQAWFPFGNSSSIFSSIFIPQLHFQFQKSVAFLDIQIQVISQVIRSLDCLNCSNGRSDTSFLLVSFKFSLKKIVQLRSFITSHHINLFQSLPLAQL